jgi:hypothetical protein
MSMSHEETIAFVERLYAVTGVGDWETAADMLTEDFVAYEADGMPMAGAYRGKNGLHDLFVKVMAMVDVVGLERDGARRQRHFRHQHALCRSVTHPGRTMRDVPLPRREMLRDQAVLLRSRAVYRGL